MRHLPALFGVIAAGCWSGGGTDIDELGGDDTAFLESPSSLPFVAVGPPTIAPNGFRYPMATSWSNGNYGACGQYYYTGYCHNGIDQSAARGTPVYSLAAGTVLRQSGTQDAACSSGWGYDYNGGNNCNMALMIQYYDDDGNPFVVVLGHLQYATTYRTGTGTVSPSVGVVTPGQVIGYIGGYYDTAGARISSDHLHFGIYPGTTSPTTNLGRVSCGVSQQANTSFPVGCSSAGFTAPGSFMSMAGRSWVAPPVAPTLTSPANGAVLNAAGGVANVALTWSNGSGTYRTHGMVCQDRNLTVGCVNPDGGMVGFESSLVGAQRATRYTIPFAPGTWYWSTRGAAYNDYGGWGSYAAVRSFTVR